MALASVVMGSLLFVGATGQWRLICPSVEVMTASSSGFWLLGLSSMGMGFECRIHLN